MEEVNNPKERAGIFPTRSFGLSEKLVLSGFAELTIDNYVPQPGHF